MKLNAISAGPTGAASPVTAPKAPLTDQGAPVLNPAGRKFLEVLGETRSPPPTSVPPKVDAAPAGAQRQAGPAGINTEAGMRRLTEGVFSAEKRLDAIISAAARGKTFTSAELIGLQAEVFRYSQTVEIISRSTDKLVGALKQTLSTQV